MAGVTTAYQTGIHSARPANGVGCILYDCTTHGLIYRDDGTTWTTFSTLGTPGAYSPGGTDVAVADGGTGASTASGARTNLGLAIGTDIDARVMTTQDDLIVGGVSGAAARLGKGSDGQVLTVDPSTHHLVWATPSSGFANPMTTKGDVILGDTGGTATRLGAGTAGDVLTSNGAAAFPSYQTPSGGGSGAVLGALAYSSGSDTALGTIATSTSTDIDATHLSLAITIPASGKIVVMMQCDFNVTVANGTAYIVLRTGSSEIGTPATATVYPLATASGMGASTTAAGRQTFLCYATGLTPGALTIKAGFRNDGGSTSFHVYGNDGAGGAGHIASPFVMVAFAA